MLQEVALGLLALALRMAVFEPFTMSSGSMEPTLERGEWFMSYKLPFLLGIGHPERGEVVIYRREDGTTYIHRLVGLPGDHIQMRDGTLVLNGTPVPRQRVGERTEIDSAGREQHAEEYVETLPDGTHYHILERGDDGPLDNTPAFIVPAGHFFVLGDNRDSAADSRVPQTGFIPLEALVGRPVWLGD